MSVDHLLAAAGVSLALGSAALPLHVWTSPESYGRPRIVLERLDEERSGGDRDFAAFAPRREPVLVTGSVPSPPKRAPAPVIVFATATHALARLPGTSEIALLRPGSKLGDGDAVASIALRDGRWTVLTRNGRALAVSR